MPKKAPLILMHGFRGNSLGVKDIATKLKLEDYEVYTPSIPPAIDIDGDGFTDETLPPEFFTKDGYADWLADYIRKNHIERPVIIGHSMGSIIAAATAEKYPNLIADKLILMSPISNNPPKVISNLSPLVHILPPKIISTITTEYLLIDRKSVNKKEIINVVNVCALQTRNKKDLRSAAKFSSKYSVADFNFKKDTAFIAGEKDRIVSKKATLKLAEKFDAECIFIKNAGHLINYECPDKVADEILKFLKQPPHSHRKTEAK
ncbi:MAG: alpha/beta hydrolase [Candidatus Saccharibacteria bacterium]|nr:alpha/beta hydrolase [Candidatus Saccharibacteria bacterium]